MARKIVVTSGKGGVGKTSVVANLAVKLAQSGRRVCMLDADFGLNNLDLVMGSENMVVYDLIDCLEGRCRPKQALIQSKINKNVYLMPSIHTLSKSEISFERLNELIVGLSPLFDFIIIDCPAGVGVGFSTAVSLTDEALLVTTSQLSALRDADKTLSALRGMGIEKIQLVVNRVRGDLVISRAVLSPEEIEKQLKCPLVGVIPEDDNIFLYNAGAFSPDSPPSKAFKILASNILHGKNKIYDYSLGYRGFWGSIKRGLKRSL